MGLTCLHHCCVELDPFQAWFAIEEHSTKRPLDVRASFTPTGIIPWVGKFLCAGFIISTLVLHVLDYVSDHYEFYPAYYQNLTLIGSAIYSIMSFVNSLVPVTQPTGRSRVPFRVGFAWFLFAIVVHAQFVTAVHYWAVIWDGKASELEYLDVAPHGPPLIALMIDGFHINRIPLRWMHLWASETVAVLYIVWSIIHSNLILDLDIPSDVDENVNDDNLYEYLSWEDGDIERTIIICLVVLFVILPVLFFFLRAYSRYHVLLLCGGCIEDHFRYWEEGEDGDDAIKGQPEDEMHETYVEENPYLHEDNEEYHDDEEHQQEQFEEETNPAETYDEEMMVIQQAEEEEDEPSASYGEQSMDPQIEEPFDEQGTAGEPEEQQEFVDEHPGDTTIEEYPGASPPTEEAGA